MNSPRWVPLTVDACRFTDTGLICEHWGLIDVASMMRQLGVGAES